MRVARQQGYYLNNGGSNAKEKWNMKWKLVIYRMSVSKK